MARPGTPFPTCDGTASCNNYLVPPSIFPAFGIQESSCPCLPTRRVAIRSSQSHYHLIEMAVQHARVFRDHAITSVAPPIFDLLSLYLSSISVVAHPFLPLSLGFLSPIWCHGSCPHPLATQLYSLLPRGNTLGNTIYLPCPGGCGLNKKFGGKIGRNYHLFVYEQLCGVRQ